MPTVSQRPGKPREALQPQPRTQQHQLCLGSAFSIVLVTSGAGAWDGPDCPGLVLITFCHHHGTVTSASAAGDVISILGVPTFPWLLPPRSGPHLLFLFELLPCI